MFRKYHPKIASGVALVLLLFSSVDLLGDVGGLAVCSSDSTVELHEDVPHDDEDHAPNPLDQSSSHPEEHHFDDCFCCSHCVQHTAEFVLMPGESVALVAGDGAVLHLHLFAQELFRPPQAS